MKCKARNLRTTATCFGLFKGMLRLLINIFIRFHFHEFNKLSFIGKFIKWICISVIHQDCRVLVRCQIFSNINDATENQSFFIQKVMYIKVKA